MIKLSDISLYDLLPPNLQADPVMTAAAKSLDAQLQTISTEIKGLDIFGRSEEWTDEETDALAWEFRPPYYDPDLPLEQRRQLVWNAIPFHRRKGTPSAVEDLITILFGQGEVQEWWEYGGDPHHFRVVTNNADVTTTRAQEFIDAVDAVKRLTAILDSVTITQTEEMVLYFKGFVHIGEKITI